MIEPSALLIRVGQVAVGSERLAVSAQALGWDTADAADFNEADEVARASSVDFVAFVTAGGEVLAGAAEALALGADPEIDVIFGDGLIGRGSQQRVILRPISSPERLRCQFYWGELVLFRRASLVNGLPLDSELTGAELYDLALRSTRENARIEHLAVPVFLADEAPGHLNDDSRASVRIALERHLAATGGGIVREVGVDGVHDTVRLVHGEPLVSIIIPTRAVYADDQEQPVSYLLNCLHSIVGRSTYHRLEFVLVVDDGADPRIMSGAEELLGDRLRVVEWDRPFNFSGKINLGVLASEGEYLLILNDDVEVIDADWIERLLALAQLPGSGGAGALLYYEDGSIQHAGHAYFEDDASHIGLDAAPTDPGPLEGYRVEREVSGVTAACMMVARPVYFEAGGMSILLPGNFNDVDFCMKVTFTGHTIYWTPHARLYHFESKTRDPLVHGFEVQVAWSRWGHRMHDPDYWPYPHSRTPHRMLVDRW